MRVVLGFAAAGILLAGYTVCPDTVRASVTETVTPSEQMLDDIDDGMEAIMSLFRGPGDIQPEQPI